MSITAQPTETLYALAGSGLGPFSTVWDFEQSADVVVLLDNGAGVFVVVGAGQYTLSDPNPPATGGMVTLSNTLLTAGAWPAGARLALKRAQAFDQPSQYGESFAFSPQTCEEALDHVGRQAQQLATMLARAIRLGPGETAADLPGPAARAGQALVFDGAGAPSLVPQINLSTSLAGVSSSLTAVSTTLTGEAATRSAADAALTTSLSAEANTRSVATASLATALSGGLATALSTTSSITGVTTAQASTTVSLSTAVSSNLAGLSAFITAVSAAGGGGGGGGSDIPVSTSVSQISASLSQTNSAIVSLSTGVSSSLSGQASTTTALSAGVSTSLSGQASVTTSLTAGVSSSLSAQASTNAALSSGVSTSLSATASTAAAVSTALAGLTATVAPGAFRNLKGLQGASGQSTATYTADSILLTGAGAAAKLLAGFNQTVNLTTSGTGGLDTGTVGASTWYYVFATWNGSSAGILASLSATAPTLPGGVTSAARIGAIRTDGSGKVTAFIQYGRQTQWINTGAGLPQMASGSAGSTSGSYVAVATGAFVPPTAGRIALAVHGDSTIVGVAPNANYGAYNSSTAPPPVIVNGGTPNAQVAEMTLESANVYWFSSGSISVLYAFGYEDNL